MEEKHNVETLGKGCDSAEEENERLKKKLAELEESLLQKGKEIESLNDTSQMQETRGLRKEVHIMEDRVQSLPKKNEEDKPKNEALAEEAKAKGNMFYKLGRLEEACECFFRVLDLADDQAD
ncbi:uncharacterized protein LOC135208389 [Macrobrachium nipponense]|uniref:uncharacterized protein LOC135208389 n=1 Tax=Macrobrachium nipponense TaxID=159736 RepID=UPI0030C8B8CC